MKILVADDSKTNLTLLSASLEKLGHEVVAVGSGKAALDIFPVANPDLVILDVVMEGMDGFECAKRLRALGTEDWIPIIFLSASVDDDSIAKGIDAGGDDYLTKPCSEITLAAKIKAMQRIATMRNELYDATKKLAKLSATDSLTGCNNRLQFNKVIKEKIGQAERQETLFALLFLDLDKFKEVNDKLGHHIGDLLLIEVGSRLQSCLRVNDFLARMGGDEFAIILSDFDDQSVVDVVAKKIISTLSQPYVLEKHELYCFCSIGIVFYPSDGSDASTLTIHADVAMYQAKCAGRNNFKYYQNISHKNGLLQREKPRNNHKIRSFSDEKKPLTVLHCSIMNTFVCIDIRYIKKNLPLAEVQALPESPAYVLGLMDLSGRPVPLVDLGLRLNLERREPYSLDAPVLLCSNNETEVAFIVDKILGLYSLEKEDLQAYNYPHKNTQFLATLRLGEDLSLLVNMEHLLKEETGLQTIKETPG